MSMFSRKSRHWKKVSLDGTPGHTQFTAYFSQSHSIPVFLYRTGRGGGRKLCGGGKSIKEKGSGLSHILEKERIFWIEYSGSVKFGIDMSKVDMQVSGTQITITIPRARLLIENYIEQLGVLSGIEYQINWIYEDNIPEGDTLPDSSGWPVSFGCMDTTRKCPELSCPGHFISAVIPWSHQYPSGDLHLIHSM